MKNVIFSKYHRFTDTKNPRPRLDHRYRLSRSKTRDNTANGRNFFEPGLGRTYREKKARIRLQAGLQPAQALTEFKIHGLNCKTRTELQKPGAGKPGPGHE